MPGAGPGTAGCRVQGVQIIREGGPSPGAKYDDLIKESGKM